MLISADYSQIELRVLAHMASEETLIEAFRRGEDIHDQTAEKIFGAASGMDKHRRRSIAKMINYALLYGKQAFTLSKDIGVTPQVAQQFIDQYFAGFPRVRQFLDRTLEEARASGVVKTMYGRRRRVPEINSRNFQDRGRAERETLNMPIQGTAADIMKRAMIDTHAALNDRPQARMILTVHDELLFEVPKAEVDEFAALVRDSMQSAAQLAVPLTVDVGIGENWKEAKGLTDRAACRAHDLAARHRRGCAQGSVSAARSRSRRVSGWRQRPRPSPRPPPERLRHRDVRPSGSGQETLPQLLDHRAPVPPRAREVRAEDHRGRDVPASAGSGRRSVADGVPAPDPTTTEGRHLIHHDNTFGTPEEDAFRRDFTVNALCVQHRRLLDHRLRRRPGGSAGEGRAIDRRSGGAHPRRSRANAPRRRARVSARLHTRPAARSRHSKASPRNREELAAAV